MQYQALHNSTEKRDIIRERH